MFDPDVKEELRKRLIGVELQRVKRKKQLSTFWLFTFFIVIASVAFNFGMDFDEIVIAVTVIISVITIAIGAIISYQTKRKLTANFKENVLLPSLKKKHPQLNYNQSASISRDEFVASEIFSSFRVSRFNGEDLFSGIEGKTHFKFSEVHAEERRTRSNGKGGTQTYYVTIFKGIFMIADFNKRLSYTTRVIQAADGFFEKLFAGKSKVSLEHPVFEKMFNTYSQDQVEARYILTPAMMERLVELQKQWSSNLNVSFKGNNMFVAISNPYNHFEPNLRKEIDIPQIERIFDEIESCLSIINTLDLNTRIWTKD